MTMIELVGDRVRGVRRRLPRPLLASRSTVSWSNRPHWWWKVALGLTPFIVVAIGYAWLQSPFARADRVVVSGLNRVEFGEVVVASNVLHAQLIDIDPAAAEAKLEALPFVRDATVVRDWPNAVNIDVVEREPVGSFANADATWSIVDAEGRVLGISPGIYPSHPALVGFGAPPAPGEFMTGEGVAALLEAGATVPLELWQNIATLELGDDGQISAMLGDWQTVVLLGDADDLGRKYRSLASVLVSTDLDGVSVIDVRVPDAPVLIRGAPTG